MADLYPTPTRLKLLRGVQRQEVTYYTISAESYWDGHGRGRQVTSWINELKHAGWVHRPGTVVDQTQCWALTDLGGQVLGVDVG